MPQKNKVLKKRALRINQNDGNPLYVFSLTGTELLKLASHAFHVTRRKLGYQRVEFVAYSGDY